MAVLGWQCCCCGSCTIPFPLTGPVGSWLASLPSSAACPAVVTAVPAVFAFSGGMVFGKGWQGLPLGVRNFSASLPAGLPGETVCFVLGTLEPSLGIPLDAGVQPSFLAAALLPFGIRLAIFEAFLGAESGACSFSSLPGLSGPALPLSRCCLSSLSLGCSRPFLLPRLLLPALGVASFGDTLGLLLADPPLVPSSRSPGSGPVVSSSLALSGPRLLPCGVRSAERVLTSLNFSSIDFWAGATLSEGVGAFSLSVGGGDVAGLGCLTANSVAVALCLALMDLLRQALPEPGDGMAEGGGCEPPFVPVVDGAALGESGGLETKETGAHSQGLLTRAMRSTDL